MAAGSETETVNRDTGNLIPVSAKVTRLEKGLLRACAEKAGEEFLSSYLRGVLREHIREELGAGALDG